MREKTAQVHLKQGTYSERHFMLYLSFLDDIKGTLVFVMIGNNRFHHLIFFPAHTCQLATRG